MPAPRPQTTGLSIERLRRIDEFLEERYIKAGRLPNASLLVARGGKTVHHGLHGWADVERGARVRENTLYRLYSMSQPLTSVLFMMLVEEGKVALDDPVEAVLPAWKGLSVAGGGRMGRPMQMADLLRHTSGLTSGLQGRTEIDAAYRAQGIGLDTAAPLGLEAMVEKLAGLPLEHAPGQGWTYSVATDVLGRVIELIEGQPFATVIRARLIEPLGMVDTDFLVPSHKVDRFAACYAQAEGDKLKLHEDPRTSRFLQPPTLVSGGAGLVSTITDYLRFCTMLLNGGELAGRRYLSPRTLALMTANHLPGGTDLAGAATGLYGDAAHAGLGFGLGFGVLTDPVKALLPSTRGEFSWHGGASTLFWVDPREDLAVIFMTQLVPPTAYPLWRELRSLVYGAITESFVS